MKNRIAVCIQESINNYNRLLDDLNLQEKIVIIVKESVRAFKNKNKILLCGNGGSASDAQHIASELSGKFYIDRPPLHAEALHVNSSYMTAVSNDYGFEETYTRMVEALGKESDILIGLSTSGKSKNVLNALQKAKEMNMFTIGFTGINESKINDICDITINVPSNDTPRIQEAHILIGHIICELIEQEIFSHDYSN